MDPGTMEIKHDAKVQRDASKNGKGIHERPVRCIQANLLGNQRGGNGALIWRIQQEKGGSMNSQNGNLAIWVWFGLNSEHPETKPSLAQARERKHASMKHGENMLIL